MDPEPTLEADLSADPDLLHMLAEAATAVDEEGGATGNVTMAAAGGAGVCSAAAPTPAESAQVSTLLQKAVGTGTALASGLAALSNRVFALSTCFRRKLKPDLINGSYALSPAALYLLTNPKAPITPELRHLINQVHNAGLSAALEIGRVGRAIAADADCATVLRHLKMYLAYKILRDSLNKGLKSTIVELKIRGEGPRGGPVAGIPLGLNIASQPRLSGDVETTIQTLNRLAAECGAEMGITPGVDNTMPTITAGQETAAVAWLNAELEKETGSRTVTPGLSQPNWSSRFGGITGPNIPAGSTTGRSAVKIQRNFLKEIYDTFDKTDQQKMIERIDIFLAKVQARANYTGKTVASYLKTVNAAIEKFLSELAKSSVEAKQRNTINKFLANSSIPSTPVLDSTNIDTLLNRLEGVLQLNDTPDTSANSVARNNSAAKRPATNGAGTGGYRRSRRHRSKPTRGCRSTHRRSTRRRSTHRRSTHRRSTRRHSKI
jgi:hypothetical protein